MRSSLEKYLLSAIVLPLILTGCTRADQIDLLWSTFLGGSGDDYAYGVAVDDSGHVYLTGQSQSPDFPSGSGPGGPAQRSADDFFVAKLSPSGTTLHYLTFLGGSGADAAAAVAGDAQGNAYVTGRTASADFPHTPGAFDITLDGPGDVFLVKLNSTGSLLEYATYLGGTEDEEGTAITVDGTGRASLTGATTSPDFPVSAVAFDTSHNGGWDVFATKFTDWGGALEFSTLVGGSDDDFGHGVAIDNGGNVFVTGRTQSPDFPTTVLTLDSTFNGGDMGDAFITKVHLTGSVLSYSTFLGGSGADFGQGIAVERDGSAQVMGFTASEDFPTTHGALDTTHNGGGYDVFLARLNPRGYALTYSTFLGGSGEEYGYGLAIDPGDNSLLAGFTRSNDFPITPDAYASELSGDFDVFVAILNAPDHSYHYGTYLGSSRDDFVFGPCIAGDDSGNVYVAGYTASPGFPVTPGVLDTVHHGGFDLFLAKFGSPAGTQVTRGEFQPARPRTCILSQNVPNPFNAATHIRYRLPRPGRVSLEIFNTRGQRVRCLIDEEQSPGEHSVSWGGRDDGGRAVASGIYFCRLQAGDDAAAIKMTLVR